jgi:hypothetical protein
LAVCNFVAITWPLKDNEHNSGKGCLLFVGITSIACSVFKALDKLFDLLEFSFNFVKVQYCGAADTRFPSWIVLWVVALLSFVCVFSDVLFLTEELDNTLLLAYLIESL